MGSDWKNVNIPCRSSYLECERRPETLPLIWELGGNALGLLDIIFTGKIFYAYIIIQRIDFLDTLSGETLSCESIRRVKFS